MVVERVGLRVERLNRARALKRRHRNKFSLLIILSRLARRVLLVPYIALF